MKIKPSRNGVITLPFSDIVKSCSSRVYFTSQVCLLTLFAKIKLSQKFPDLQYIHPPRRTDDCMRYAYIHLGPEFQCGIICTAWQKCHGMFCPGWQKWHRIFFSGYRQNLHGMFCPGGKSLWDFLSGVSKIGMRYLSYIRLRGWNKY